jgi:hypothetical protein
MSLPRKIVKTRRRPPESMRKTKIAKATLKIRGRDGWIFFNPTRGTYQRRKIKKKKIRQVRTKRPMKILFFGLIFKIILPQYKLTSRHK